MTMFYRILGIVIFGGLSVFTFHMDQKAISKGKYHKELYGGKTTIWSFPCYFSFVMLMICIFSLFSK